MQDTSGPQLSKEDVKSMMKSNKRLGEGQPNNETIVDSLAVPDDPDRALRGRTGQMTDPYKVGITTK